VEFQRNYTAHLFACLLIQMFLCDEYDSDILNSYNQSIDAKEFIIWSFGLN